MNYSLLFIKKIIHKGGFTMVNRKTIYLRKLIVLAAALLLVVVGISCKNNKPTAGDEISLEAPPPKENVLGDTTDGMLTPERASGFDDSMVNVRLLSDSGSGAYYRAPVIITYGSPKKTSMAVFMEKRYGAGGVGDVGVDGNSKTDIVFFANDRGGDSLDYTKDYIVGPAGVSANTHGAEHSKASVVVFVHENGTDISIVAAAGTGNLGTTSRNGSRKSEVKISKGTKGVNTINFGEWGDLEISYTSGGTELKGSDAILKYAQEKIDGSFNAFYTRWGQGKTDGKKWILPLKLMARDANNPNVVNAQAVLVLYSEDEGANWKFGPYFTLGESAGFNEATGLSLKNDTVKLALVPRNPGNPIGIATGALEDCSQNAKALTRGGQSSFNDSYNNFETYAPYFINTRERSSMQYNSHIVNKKLTIAVLSDVDGLQEERSMLMSRVSGSGSVAVLEDDSIVTVAEEAFAEYSTVSENRYNLVQRRFTRGYINKRERILEEEEYYNPNLEGH